MNSYSVSIIIPNFNGSDLLSKNLPLVEKAFSNLANKIKEVIVVDDASTDDSVSLIKNNFPKFKIIKHKINRGFASSVNTGVRSAKGNLIVLLNSDVAPEHDFMKSIFKSFEDEKTFAVSLHEKGYGASRGYFYNGVVQLGQYKEVDEKINTFFVSGGSGVYRKKYWLELSGMDEKLLTPFYWEDIDLSYRSMKRGYINYWDPKAKVLHLHESTISKLPKKYVSRIRERNQLLMIWKNIHSKTLFRKHVTSLLIRSIKHVGYIRIIIMALIKIVPLMKARAKEIKESKISDEAIFERFHE